MNFLTGTVPVRTDSKWKLWFKFAKLVKTGSNEPKFTNSRRQLKVKVLKSLDGI